METYHNEAKPGEIAKTVLMPGDPLRAKYLAETYLENLVLINSVRGMLGYTGTFHGKPVSVMGSGMGIPSIGIYSHELYGHYDVDQIIRIGTAGAYAKELSVLDILMVTDAYSDSTYALCNSGFSGHVTAASLQLNNQLRKSAARLGVFMREGRIHSSDVIYYNRPENETPYWIQMREEQGCLAVDMESFALFHNASIFGKQAACLLTVSDQKVTGEHASTEAREKGLGEMIQVALGIL